MSLALWQRGCERLAAELPEQQFNTWIRPLVPNASAADGTPIAADTVVFATTNTSETMVADELVAWGFERPVHLAGDALAARLAVHAIYDGRVCGQRT